MYHQGYVMFFIVLLCIFIEKKEDRKQSPGVSLEGKSR